MNPNTQARPKGSPTVPQGFDPGYAAGGGIPPERQRMLSYVASPGTPGITPAVTGTAPQMSAAVTPGGPVPMAGGPVPMAPQRRGFMPPMGQPQYGPGDIGGGMSSRAAMAQQRRNRAFSRAQAPQFNQFTGGGAQYIGARDGQVTYDYGNGRYKQGTNPGNLRDVTGNFTYLRS